MELTCRAEKAEEALEDALDCLEDMIAQYCGVCHPEQDADGYWYEVYEGLDSMALSAKLAKAMELLAEYGRVVIKSIKGRRVIADWPKEGEE